MRNAIKPASVMWVVLCFFQPAWPGEPSSLLTQADAAYSKREDIPEAKIAMVIYERAAVTDSAHAVEAYWKASRAAWWLGENTADRVEQLQNFQTAIHFAQKAVQLNPDSVEAHFWLGANEGTYGKAKGVLKSLSLVKSIRHEMAEVLRLNDHYLSGAAYRVLGVVDLKVPALMGGNLTRSKEELDQALRLGPEDPFVHYDYVQFYLASNNSDKARAALQGLRALQVASEMAPEHKMLIAKAEKLLGDTH